VKRGIINKSNKKKEKKHPQQNMGWGAFFAYSLS